MKCRTANPEEKTFCQRCHTRLPKRYLRVVNFSDQEFAVGDTLADRFVFRSAQVVLDIRPGLLMNADYDIPDLFLPYLKLFRHRIHYAQFFAVIWVGEEDKSPILLLDQAPFSPNDIPHAKLSEDDSPHGIVAPLAGALPLTQVWPQAQPLRQLNWLWQLAQLWDPFVEQNVAKSLISPGLLRVEGPLLRLLELHNDSPEDPPTLAQLGQIWSKLKPTTSECLNSPFSEICNDLIEEEITDAQTLTSRLESLMGLCRDEKKLTVSLATRTDPGRVRTHNEDQCFPANGSYIQHAAESLLIVCDGVGGHAGGEVASAIAIEALQQHIGQLELDSLSPAQIQTELVAACCHANDLISERNDQEQRQERARMGTTLVMALIHNQQLYIAHIGDSRAYLVTKLGCYQLTVDDDIASREVRLGYLPYQEALRHPTSGSLVQALGMASSNMLHPTVQRFVLDDESILLLCSDGLSDYDRVEELWQEELLPLLYRNHDLSTISNRLITLANQLNGHDNVTVGVMSLSYSSGEPMQSTVVQEPLDAKSTAPDLSASTKTEPLQPSVELDQDTKIQAADQAAGSSRLLLFGVLGAIAALLGGAVWAALSYLPITGSDTPDPDVPAPPREIENPVLNSEPEARLIKVDQFFEVNANGLTVHLTPPTPLVDAPEAVDGKAPNPVLPEGAILRITNLSVLTSEGEAVDNWLQGELCAQSNDASSELPLKGDQIWIQESDLQASGDILPDPNLSQFGVGICNDPKGEVEAGPQP